MTACRFRAASRTSEDSHISKNRPISRKSFVDETLFKSPSKTALRPEQGKLQEETVTISKEQFDALMAPAPILSFEEHQVIRKKHEEILQASREQANRRKLKMLEMEEERKKNQPKTESEVLKEKEDKETMKRARILLDEQLDDVKCMNQMVMYAKCAAIREKQVQEKQEALEKEKEEQRRLDQIMEEDRVRALKAADEAEKEKAETRRAGAKVISQQLKEREIERQRETEALRLEEEEVTRNIEKVRKEDQEVMLKRKEAADRMMREVALANQDQIRRKEEIKLQEKEEEMRILEYVRQREAREQEEILAKERFVKEKELETARLRAQQERVADKQAELDELRARRYQEMKEKEWRQKELQCKRRKEETMLQLAKARESQKAAKIRQLGDMARIEQQEFFRVLEVNKAKAVEDAEEERKQREAKVKYLEELKAQVAKNGEARKLAEDQEYDESVRIKQTVALERNKILSIKDSKIRGLQENGIPDKYIAQLAKKKM